jgi:hypothetical protein
MLDSFQSTALVLAAVLTLVGAFTLGFLLYALHVGRSRG